jgi:uncharacterized membrane protein
MSSGRSFLSKLGFSRRARARRLLVASAVVVGLCAVPVMAPSADASLPIVPGPASSLSDAFQTLAPSFLQALLCPVGQTLATVTSTIPGINTLTDGIATILCALNILGYAYRTTYYPPTGPPQVRYYRALAFVPALLDVNGDGLPDFTGTVSTTATVTGIQLDITRIGLTPTSRVKIEAVFLDPADPQTWVGVGEDGSVAGTAKYWRTSITDFLFSGSSGIDLQLNLYAQNTPSTLATFGEAFFGNNPDAPTTIDAGTMSFTPVPTNFTTRLRIGPDSQTANITSTIPTVLGVHVQAISPGDEKDIDATVNQLPTAIELFHRSTGGHELVTYSANAPIAQVTGSYHDKHGSNIITAAQADITNLPSAFSLDQSDGVTVFNVPSGSIGNVEVRFATGQDVPASPAGTAPYLAFHRFSASHLTAGVRMGNIKSLSFDQRGPYVGDIVFSTAPGLIPFSAQDDVSGITANGHLSNLPAHLTVTIDLQGGHVVFDGHGTGIDAIVVNATRSPGVFFTRANRIDLAILGLPALDTIDFAPGGSSVNFTPSAPIGSVSFLASDGTPAPGVSGDYASYEDTPTLYRLYVQMFSIAGASFATSPAMSATLKTGVSLPMALFAHIADAAHTHDITFNGAITNLPTSITVTADLNNGQLNYNASSAISEIDASARDSLANFFGRVNRLDLTILGLPAQNNITFLPNGAAVTFQPSSPIGQVSLLASDGTGAPAVSGDYASYEDTPSLFRIFLQMQSIAGAQFSTSPTMNASLQTGVSLPMVLFAHIKNASHDLTFNGAIKNLPTNISVNTDLNNGKVVYNASSTIAEIDATAQDTVTNFFARANTLSLTLKGLPQTNTINFKPSGQEVTFQPSSPITSVALLASDGHAAPSVSGDFASYEDTPSIYRAFLQMQSIAGAEFKASPTITATLKTGVSQEMDLFAHIKDNAATHDLTFNGAIKNLPTNITVNADLNNGKFVYNANSTIAEIDVSAQDSLANFFGRVNTVAATIKGLPQTNTIDFLPGGSGVNFTPSSPIGSVSLLASDGTGAPSVSGDYASYEDTPSYYRIFLQMVGIAGVTFNTNPLSGELKTSSPQPMTLYGRLQNATNDITATGSINNLPSDISFSLNQSGGSTNVDYNTHGQVVNTITLDAQGVPLPFGADTVHAQITHLPSHITVTIPAAGSSAVFNPHGDVIQRVLVQAYPHSAGAVNAASGHQLAYANLHTGQFTADIHNIGFTSFSTDASNINIHYDISSEPLDFELDTADGSQYFKGQISNPEPAGINVDTNNGVAVNYQVDPSGANYTGDGSINEIDVQTNVFGGYMDVALQHISPKLAICFDSGGSTKCTPGFVPTPGQYFSDSDGNNWLMPNSSLDFYVTPTDLAGNTWPTRFRLDGTVCFSEPDAATCLDGGNKKERVVISDLEFGRIAVGAGTQEDGCTLCTQGRIYGYFDTDNTKISGDVQYFKGGDDGPFIHYSQDSGSGDGFEAQNFFAFIHYCVPCLNSDWGDLVTGGSYTCVGSPHLDIDTFVDIDILSGLIGLC